MVKYLVNKLLYGFLVMTGVICIVFFLFNILPGDPARMMLGQRADVSSVESINRELGRDLPVTEQFFLYLNDLSPLSVHKGVVDNSHWSYNKDKYGSGVRLLEIGSWDFMIKAPYLRRSYQTNQKVSEILLDALPGTAILATVSLVLASVIGVLLGIISALKRNTWIDYLSMITAVMGMAIPSFFAGIIIAWLFGFVLSDYTGLSMTGSLYEVDPFEGLKIKPANLILPALTLGIRPLSVIVQLTRSSMLEVLSKDYVRTAKAKGLKRNAIIIKHTLKNALNPVLTAVSGWFGSLLAGAVFIEYIFGWKGIGKVTVDSLERYDFPVVMGAVLIVSILFVIINILVDLLYGVLDPRVRIG